MRKGWWAVDSRPRKKGQFGRGVYLKIKLFPPPNARGTECSQKKTAYLEIETAAPAMKGLAAAEASPPLPAAKRSLTALAASTE